MKSFYISCFLLVLVVVASSLASPFGFGKEDDENGNHGKISGRMQSDDWTCSVIGEPCSTWSNGYQYGSCCYKLTCESSICVYPGKK